MVREQPFVVALLQAHDASRVGSPIGAVPPMVAEACVQGDEERVLTWLQCGGQVDAKHIGDDGECTLLLLACEAGWSSLVSKLIDLGADTTVTRSKDKATAMLLAAHNGHREVVRILCDQSGLGSGLRRAPLVRQHIARHQLHWHPATS